jgi:hypothetical protein
MLVAAEDLRLGELYQTFQAPANVAKEASAANAATARTFQRSMRLLQLGG